MRLMLKMFGENHDYYKYPELTNKQIEEYGMFSPHPQITNDFNAKVEKVVDGDTIRLSCEGRNFIFPLRFLNINAPEMNEGGEEAKTWLKNLIEGTEVMIKINRQNRVGKYGRLLGMVLSMGMDVGQMMLDTGRAVPFGRNQGEITDINKVLRMQQWL